METVLNRIAAHLLRHGQRVTCAESCTGGLLAGALTSVAGSSQWFEQSWVTYSNQAKMQMLGVRQDTLAVYGAVSSETVQEMAAGARLAAEADYALSVSGIAGPGGGSDEKPVGTVWFGLSADGILLSRKMHFAGDRNQVRDQAVAFALEWLAEHLQPEVA
ncbi:CinA family protein [Bergeriella denitrificans]|uniref:Competence/damage-inducible protein CinA C-terminal domain n=1 Tax=Bergeriella denitrificans TaxID=494 RepID=A0A378UIY0_BERDE|nr:CinA family protein [Bergeriella denitrificans]STZ77296.1 Competence/damage-inducible protein CinA C-terminal domain [Bergeriella denitrificans]